MEDIAARPLEFADALADRITHDAGNIAFGMGAATSPDERAQAMANYQRQIETTFLHQAVEESAQNALQRAVLGAESGSLVPGFGIAGIPRTPAAQPRQSDVDNPGPEANKMKTRQRDLHGTLSLGVFWRTFFGGRLPWFISHRNHMAVFRVYLSLS